MKLGMAKTARCIRRQNKLKEKEHVKRLREYTIFKVCFTGDRYYRCWDNDKTLKRISNRKVRRCKDVSRRGQYKKVFDYWYSLH